VEGLIRFATNWPTSADGVFRPVGWRSKELEVRRSRRKHLLEAGRLQKEDNGVTSQAAREIWGFTSSDEQQITPKASRNRAEPICR
jgi:hypothetical protein